LLAGSQRQFRKARDDLLAVRGAERSDLRKKTVNNSDELMPRQGRIELSTSSLPRAINRKGLLGTPRAHSDLARGAGIGGMSACAASLDLITASHCRIGKGDQGPGAHPPPHCVRAKAEAGVPGPTAVATNARRAGAAKRIDVQNCRSTFAPFSAPCCARVLLFRAGGTARRSPRVSLTFQ
jgi:hypothetical protein